MIHGTLMLGTYLLYFVTLTCATWYFMYFDVLYVVTWIFVTFVTSAFPSQVKPVELTDFLQLKKSEGYCIVGVEQTANSQSLQDYQFPEKTLLLLGYEFTKEKVWPQKHRIPLSYHELKAAHLSIKFKLLLLMFEMTLSITNRPSNQKKKAELQSTMVVA